MTLNLYKLRIRCLLRNYDNLFWSFAFPLLLSLFFYMGYGKLLGGEKTYSIPVAVVSNKSDTRFIQYMKNAELSNGKKLFLVHIKPQSQAREMLQKGEIDGYIVENGHIELYMKNNGINQSIIQSFVDNYLYLRTVLNHISAVNEKDIIKNMEDIFSEYKDYVRKDNDEKGDYVVIFYYSIIALTCMFGAFWGFQEMTYIQANQSVVASRVNVSPVRKIRLVLCDFLAVFTLHYFSVIFFIFFSHYILDIPYGNRIDMVLVIGLLGSLSGISFGAMICVAVKVNAKVRMAIINVVVIVGGFLSGMVIVDMKYIIAEHFPLIAYINPSGLITDALYCLYYYDSYPRLFTDLLILFLMTVLFCCVTYHEIRRKEYASI